MVALSPWPTRRLVALVVLLPVVGAWFLTAAAVSVGQASAAWTAVGVLASVTGAAVLASYVPTEGRRPEVGCSPCATMAAVSLVGATIALHHYGAGIEGPAVAFAVTLFGLTQRLTQPRTCPA